MRSERWDIEKLRPWDKNPRSIGKKELNRLVEQIRDLRQYKPLIITPEGVVLGGNMRLQAYKKLGLKEVWVSVVTPKNEKEMLEYALSDNDVVGRYDPERVDALLSETGVDIDRFTLSLGTSLPLDQFSEVVDSALPSQETPGDVDTIHRYSFTFEGETFKKTLERIVKVIENENLNDATEAFLALKETYEQN